MKSAEELTIGEARRQAILQAAFDAFCRHGFRRTSMEDIAEAAGMSRAALYLHFHNKNEIFRSLVQHYFDATVERVGAILAADAPVATALAQALEAQGGEVIAALLASPHGAEFLDTKTTSSADIAAEGEARLRTVYADWLRRGAAAGLLRLDGLGAPEDLAGMILGGLHVIKVPGMTVAAYQAAVARLALLYARALAV